MTATLVRIRSWQWMLIGLLIGGLGAASVGMWGEPLLSAYGESINGRREFEEALTREEAGRPWFTEVSVHAEQISVDGQRKRTVHVVTGIYYDGRSADAAQAVWRPAFYVAEVPYEPVTSPAHLPGGGEAAERFVALPQPTVVDFLHVMNDARGARFTHAWWRSPSNARLAWLLVGVLGIGFIWPVTLNLIAYGSVRRPKEMGVELRHLSTRGSTVDGEADLAAAVEPLDDVIEDILQPDRAGAAAADAVRALATSPLEPVGAAPTSEQKSFAAGEEDYYPTEVKASKGGHR